MDGRHRAMVNDLIGVAPERMSPWFAKRIARVHSEVTKSTDLEPAVMQTMLQYLADKVDTPFIDRMSRQLLGRHAELEYGPLMPYVRPVKLEWVPFEIAKVMKTIWNGNKPGQLMTFYCLAGSPAGHRLDKKLPESWLRFIAYKIGYTRRINYNDDEPWQFLGLRFWGLVTPAIEDQDSLNFSEWAIDSQMKASNSGIIAKRNRFLFDDPDGPSEQDLADEPEMKIPKHACPERLDHYCSACPIGVADCEASVHREQFRERRPKLDAKASGLH